MRLVRVNMTNKTINFNAVSEEYKLLGGRALTGRLVLEEVPPTCEPLGSKNKLIIAPGVLAGTQTPCSGRLSIGSKSPLTGGIKEANAGGTAAGKLAYLGVKALIIEGKASKDKSYILKVSSEATELLDCSEIMGLDNYDACAKIRDRFGKDVGIIIAGPAAEKLYSVATVAVVDPDGHPARHAARGGLGSVMASRGLKAIVIDDKDTDKRKAYDENAMKDICRQWSKELVEGRKLLTEYGTANLVMAMNELGALATRNYSIGFFEKAEEISAEKLAENINKRGGNPSHACQKGCPIRCSNVYMDEKGQHLTSSLEFETLGLMGSNLGVGDLDVIARIDRFCDGFGIDTIETGGAIGVAMESGLVSFGDTDGVFNLLDQIKQGTVTGRLLAQGVAVTGRVLGVSRIPSVKGQGLAAYDPRGLKGTGVTYATSPMGSDHTAGNCLPGRVGYREETQKKLNPDEAQGQVEMSKDIQILSTICDIMGLCIFVGSSVATVQKVAHLLTAFLGEKFSEADVIALGKEAIKTELEFNRLCGITSLQNKLPEFFMSETLSPTDSVFDISDAELKEIFKELE